MAKVEWIFSCCDLCCLLSINDAGIVLYSPLRCIDFPAWIDVVPQREHLTVILLDALFTGSAAPLSLIKNRLCLWKKIALWLWETSWAWRMTMDIYSNIMGTRFQNFNVGLDKIINETANYTLQDFEVYLLMYVQEKSLPISLNLESEAKNHNYCLYFLYFGWRYLFSEKAIKLRQLPTSTEGTLAHSSVLLLQLSTQL